MKALCVKFTLLLLGCIFISGCKTLTVVPHAVSCDVNADLLAGKCAAPRPIPKDTTYAALVDTMQADRQALRECSIAAQTLRDAITRCNQATDEYNKKIDAMNGAR